MYYERHDSPIHLHSHSIPDSPSALRNYKHGNVHHSCFDCSRNDCEHCEHTLYQEHTEAAEYDFKLLAGTAFDFDLVYKDCTGNPIDLTGYRCKFLAQYDHYTFTPTARIVCPEEGKINVFMSPHETSKIYTLSYDYAYTTEYKYQIELFSPSGIAYRIMNGTIFVSPMAR